MMEQISAFGWHFIPRIDRQELGLDFAALFQDIPNFRRPDPLLGVDKVLGLIPDGHQTLLDLRVGGDGSGRVTLVPEPRDEGLQRPIGASPTVVIELVLHVVVVGVGALDQGDVTPDATRFQSVVDIDQRTAANFLLVGEHESVHPPEVGSFHGEKEHFVQMPSELGESGACASLGVDDGGKVAEGRRKQVEGFGHAHCSSHLELGQDAASHLVDLSLNTPFQYLHQIGNVHRVRSQPQSVDFQWNPQ